MSSRWIEFAKKNLEPGDDVEKSYSGYCDRKYGYLLISKKRLLFVSEEGLFSKKYNLVFSIPYEKLKTDSKRDHELEVTEVGGKRYSLVFDISLSAVMKSIDEHISSVHS